jgi:hydrogenase-4 component F
MAWRAPASAGMFIAGILAVTACPPFGPFFSELNIVLAAFKNQHGFTAAAFLGCLLFAFFGLTRLLFAIVDGRPRAAARATGQRLREIPGVIVPPLLFLAGSLWLGLATPPWLRDAWTAAAHFLTPSP